MHTLHCVYKMHFMDTVHCMHCLYTVLGMHTKHSMHCMHTVLCMHTVSACRKCSYTVYAQCFVRMHWIV